MVFSVLCLKQVYNFTIQCLEQGHDLLASGRGVLNRVRPLPPPTQKEFKLHCALSREINHEHDVCFN